MTTTATGRPGHNGSEAAEREVLVFAEQAVVGAAMQREESYAVAVAAGIAATSFVHPDHRRAWTATAQLYEAGRPVDHGLVAAQLAATGDLEATGDPAGALIGYVIGAALPATLGGYVAVVKNAADGRHLEATIRTRLQELEAGGDPSEIAGRLRAQLDDISAAAATAGSSSWLPVDLGPAVRGELPAAEVGILHRSDGLALLYPGRVHAFVGEPESGKSWLAQLAVVTVLQGGGRATIVDFEDDASALVERLRALGATADQIMGGLTYLRPDEALSEEHGHLLDEACARAVLAVLDGTTDAMGLHGWEPRKDTDSAAFQRRILRRMAAGGAAVICIDHVVKDREARGRYATGSQHKLAGINGVQYLVEARKPWAPGHSGAARVTIGKDRPGKVRAGLDDLRTVGDMVVTAWADGGVRIDLNAPQPQEQAADGGHRPTFLMERVSTFLAAHHGKSDPSTNAVRKGVKGDSQAIDRALIVLELEGYSTSHKVGNGTYWQHAKPFTSDSEGDAESA